MILTLIHSADDTKIRAREKVESLVDKYAKIAADQKRYKRYNEEGTKREFIEPLFEALGWDLENKSLRDEVTLEENVSKGRVDYGFRINDIPKFFLEAKRLRANLDDEKFIKQAIDYSWNKACTWAVLTDFEGIKIFNAEVCSKNYYEHLFVEIKWTEFLDRFDDLWLLSKEGFELGLLDKEAERWGKKFRRIHVDKQLLDDITEFRGMLSSSITRLNKRRKLTKEHLDEAVQRILDRLIFIRYCEDKELEEKQLISNLRVGETKGKVIQHIRGLFTYYDRRYNSKIFAQHLCDGLEIDNEVLHDIIDGLYHPQDAPFVYDFSAIESDVLGKIYEQYLGHILNKTEKKARLTASTAKRKQKGIYYTPSYIVDYIVKNTLGKLIDDKRIKHEKIRIVDLACGSGSFLTKAFDVLNDYYVKHDKGYAQTRLDLGGQDVPYAKKLGILQNNIFGVDLDKQAVEITELNLFIKIARRGYKLPQLGEHIKRGNSLIESSLLAEDKAFHWNQEFQEIMSEGGFDVVIGNPPYFNVKSDDILKNSKDFKLLSYGVVNSASLFMKKGLDLLKNNGYLGFIIPKSFLIVDSWKPIRDIVLQNSLLNVCDVSMAFEEVGLEQVIIIVRKMKPHNNKVCIWNGNKKINDIPQEFFQKRGTILTSLDQEKLAIVQKIEKGSISLGDLAEMPRGITVESSEYTDTPAKENIHVLGGTNVERYRTKEGNKRKPNRYLNKTDDRIRQKHDVFIKGRIIYQNIASSVPRIVATLELDGLPTDDTLNNLLVSDPSITNKYVLAILNSKLTTFYLRYAIINCSILTIHLDKPYLGKIPIKKLSMGEQQVLNNLVDRILALHKHLNAIGDKKVDERAKIEEATTKTENEIDEIVYKIYNITDEEKEVIAQSTH